MEKERTQAASRRGEGGGVACFLKEPDRSLQCLYARRVRVGLGYETIKETMRGGRLLKKGI